MESSSPARFLVFFRSFLFDGIVLIISYEWTFEIYGIKWEIKIHSSNVHARQLYTSKMKENWK